MLCKIPSAIKKVQSDESPELTNGNVMPVTGIRPMFMPMLTNAWKNSIPVMPIARAWPSLSRATSDT